MSKMVWAFTGCFIMGFLGTAVPAFIYDVRERKRLGLPKYFWQKK